MVLRDSRVNEIHGRDVFMCEQNDDAKTVSFTRHLGSVLVLPYVDAVFPVKTVIWQWNSLRGMLIFFICIYICNYLYLTFLFFFRI